MSDELQPGSWDIVHELVWLGHPLMVAAADEIKRLRNYTKTGVVETPVADDIVTRLRERQSEVEAWWPDSNDPPLTTVGEAADEIERLRHVVDRLNAALDDITHLTVDRQVLHRIVEARRG